MPSRKPRPELPASVNSVGYDEAGFGTAAGGMYATAFAFNDHVTARTQYGHFVRDSKTLSHADVRLTAARLKDGVRWACRSLTMWVGPEHIDFFGGGAARVALLQTLLFYGRKLRGGIDRHIIDGTPIFNTNGGPPSDVALRAMKEVRLYGETGHCAESVSHFYREHGDASKWFGLRPYVDWVVKGDSIHLEVAAASIMAKAAQLERMADLHKRYPEYGFANHNGYLTPEHKEAIARYGAIPGVHRASYLRNTPQGNPNDTP